MPDPQTTSAWDQDAIDNEMFRDEEECDHIDAEVTWEGQVACMCGHTHWLSVSEWKQEMKRQREAEKAWNRHLKKCAKEDKRRPKQTMDINDDQIPF